MAESPKSQDLGRLKKVEALSNAELLEAQQRIAALNQLAGAPHSPVSSVEVNIPVDGEWKMQNGEITLSPRSCRSTRSRKNSTGSLQDGAAWRNRFNDNALEECGVSPEEEDYMLKVRSLVDLCI